MVGILLKQHAREKEEIPFLDKSGTEKNLEYFLMKHNVSYEIYCENRKLTYLLHVTIHDV